MGLFGIGQPVSRTEDPRLLTGRGRYTADVSFPEEIHAEFLRSPHAHADIVGIDTEAALAMPGVLAVYTGSDVAADGLGDIPCLIEVIDRGKAIAARLLQAAEADILFVDGLFLASGTDRGIGLADLAAAAEPENRPADDAMPGLGATKRYTPGAATYPNGCHVCEVEIDPQTGHVEIVNYRAIDDFGMVVNPLLLAGQVRDGVVQGIGQVLTEEAVYDRESGQLLTGTFLDYALPHAADVPAIEVTYNNVPCTTNPMGIKGAGEAETIAACPAVMNAVIDALAPLGVRQLDMPATAEKIWRAIRAAQPPL